MRECCISKTNKRAEANTFSLGFQIRFSSISLKSFKLSFAKLLHCQYFNKNKIVIQFTFG